MASKQVVESRLKEIAELLYKGATRAEIIKSIKPKYKISDIAIDKIIRKAKPIANELKIAQGEVIERHEGKLIVDPKNVLLAVDPKTVLSRIEKRQILAKVARGEFTVTETIVVDGTAVTIERHPTQADVARAIMIDNAMTGDNAPEKHLIADLSKVPVQQQLIIMKDGKEISLKVKSIGQPEKGKAV